MKRVLIVDFNGTAPTYNYYFVKGLLHEGLDVKVLGKENDTFTAIHEEKIKYIGINSGLKFLDYIMNWIMLFFLAKQYDVIHFQWLPMLKFTSIELSLLKMLRKTNKNIFYTVHNFFPHNSINERVNQRYIALYKLIDNLVVHADATTLKIKEQVNDKEIIKIEHGYFYAEFRNNTKKTKQYDLAMLGNILPYKGVEDAIEAIALMPENNLKLLIAGKCTPEYEASLRKLIADKALENQVFLEIGFLSVQQLIDYYAVSTLSIMPYKEIEQSGVLYTSLGLKIPIIGYKSGGISETVINNQNGYLVEKNNIAALSKAIEIGLMNRQKWCDYIEEFNIEDLWCKNARILKESYFRCVNS
ncbi:glycosyltransferase family 4 protein [Maribacter dokdonensis]|uniref:glycosyltransferase family 4 protein n=1 Tax=Maribacter dokdonensis TaxID=320912 RepID=UPI001C09908E|nr:glycosyltransferase [Maribacter dokdonensis]MBU2900550.1 glycosyltransferase [Maribacter dokdonensis]